MSLMAQKKSEAKAKAMIRDMALNDLRQARSVNFRRPVAFAKLISV
jgi:hypothetical protein